MGAEKNIEKNIRKRLEVLGFKTYKIHVGQYGPIGFPDLLVIKNGITNYFEVKKPDEVPEDIQNYQMKVLREFGCIAEPVWSFSDVMEILGGKGYHV